MRRFYPSHRGQTELEVARDNHIVQVSGPKLWALMPSFGKQPTRSS